MDVKAVLVVDDSAFMRSLITHILEQDPGLRVVGTAKNGLEAIKRVLELNPDVVTLDLEMPEMDGLSALQAIMRDHPVPVVILTAVDPTKADIMVKALALGAVDFVSKPSGPVSVDLGRGKEGLISRVKAASRADVRLLSAAHVQPLIRFPPVRKVGEAPRAIGIAASTGGPKALEVVLSILPRTLAAAVFIVQHMPASLTASFARRLGWMTAMEVVEAREGIVPRLGVAYLAPGDYHLEVVEAGLGPTLHLHQGEKVNSVRPSADVLFPSLARIYGKGVVGVVLTGMGADGAKGLLAVKNAGGTTVAQSAESCVVYGMPRAALALGASQRVLPLEAIGSALVDLVGVVP